MRDKRDVLPADERDHSSGQIHTHLFATFQPLESSSMTTWRIDSPSERFVTWRSL